MCRGPESNRHEVYPHRFLRPARLPIPPPRPISRAVKYIRPTPKVNVSAAFFHAPGLPYKQHPPFHKTDAFRLITEMRFTSCFIALCLVAANAATPPFLDVFSEKPL